MDDVAAGSNGYLALPTCGYHRSDYEFVGWSKSDVRRWLNDEFYKSKGAANFTAGPEVSHSMSLSITPTNAGDIILTGPYITGGNALISFEAVSNYTLSGFYSGSTLLSKDSPLKVEVGGSITSVQAQMTPCGRGTLL